MKLKSKIVLALLALLALSCRGVAQVLAVTTVHAFQCAPDGASPNAVLVTDEGVLYGTTYAGGSGGLGTAFKITPVAGGSATEQIIHNFTGGLDGAYPISRLTMGEGGALYGTSIKGGENNMGVVFALYPPRVPEAAWTETIVHAFAGGADGEAPFSALLIGSEGELYGQTANGGYPGTSGYGTLFKLTPPAAGNPIWTEKILYAFQPNDPGANPGNDIVFGLHGEIFGSTSLVSGANGIVSYGTVYEFIPPANGAGDWSIDFIHQFTGGDAGGEPEGPVTLGADGVIYGAGAFGGTHNNGMIYKLTPPPASETRWSYRIIHNSHGHPTGGLLMNSSGSLLGFNSSGGAYDAGSIIALFPDAGSPAGWSGEFLATLSPLIGTDPSSPTAGPNHSIYGSAFNAAEYYCGAVFVASPLQ